MKKKDFVLSLIPALVTVVEGFGTQNKLHNALGHAHDFADELEENGYFDPEPEPEPAPEEMGPWRVANWEELPENGAEIEIKDVNFVHHSKYYFCLSEKMCKKQNEKYPPVKWGTLVEYKAEWRYA